MIRVRRGFMKLVLKSYHGDTLKNGPGVVFYCHSGMQSNIQIPASVLKRSTRADCKTVAKANQAVLLDKVSPTGDTKHSSLTATTSKSIDFQSVNDGDRNVIKLN